MVNLSSIKLSNGQVNESSYPRVAVFVGGTDGIGKLTLAGLAGLGLNFKAYVIGRKGSQEVFKSIIEELHLANPAASVIWIEGEVSLLAEVKRVCDHIRTLETEVNLLFMTPGFAPFADTSEGLDVSHALGHYSRICFIENLLPLLRASSNARVISVQGGGLEIARLLNTNDLNLEQPGAFGAMSTRMHMNAMSTLTLERLAEAKENQSITFIHSHPGIVRTGNLARGFKDGTWAAWMAATFMDPVLKLFAYSFDESTQRHVYLATSGTFGGKGPRLPGIAGQTTKGETTEGLFLANWKCDTVMNAKELAKLRANAQEIVWAKAYEIIGPYI